MGVVLWYKVEFTDLKTTISSDVYSGDYLDDAVVTVTYGIGLPGKFEINFANLDLKVRKSLVGALGAKAGRDGGVKVDISLGYLDDPSGHQKVLSGRVETLQASSMFPPLGSMVTGSEEAAFKLLNTPDPAKQGAAKQKAHVHLDSATPAKVATRILDDAGVTPAGKADPSQPTRDMNDDAENAFALLWKVARRFGAEILVHEGQAQFGTAIVYPPKGPFDIPIPPAVALPFMVLEDCLVTLKPLASLRLAEFKPFQLRNGLKVDAFDFTVLGEPSLRAGQLVVAGVDGYQQDTYRILQVTHSFSPKSGYVCTGRAVKFDESSKDNADISERARRGGPDTIIARIGGKITAAAATSPSVDVGKVKTVKSSDRLATLFYEQDSTNDVGSPSVDLDVPERDTVLPTKPLASPFAWDKVGLSVPVYPGMRALLNEVRDLRDDTVVTGFLWANNPQMDRPKAKDGDWWLCLPTEVSGNPPAPAGKGANDLTAADGRRILETVGLKIVVGKASCSPVGDRPKEGTADEFLISHKSGTMVQIDSDGNVTVEGKGQNVVLKCGGATLTVGTGKVAIS